MGWGIIQPNPHAREVCNLGGVEVVAAGPQDAGLRVIRPVAEPELPHAGDHTGRSMVAKPACMAPGIAGLAKGLVHGGSPPARHGEAAAVENVSLFHPPPSALMSCTAVTKRNPSTCAAARSATSSVRWLSITSM